MNTGLQVYMNSVGVRVRASEKKFCKMKRPQEKTCFNCRCMQKRLYFSLNNLLVFQFLLNQPMSKRLKRETQSESELKKEIDGESECILKDLQQQLLSPKHCGTFWEDTWRTKLCRCAECKVKS